MLYEATIFKVDVLTLEVRLGEEDALDIEELADGRKYSDELADSIAHIATNSRDAWVLLKFERNTGFGRFLGGADKNTKKARDAGIIDSTTYEFVSKGMPVWYAFLEERGVKDGDEIYYRIRGDTLQIEFYGIEGELFLEYREVGPQHRLSVLGSYFVRGSDFRKGLIKSLFERSGTNR